MPAPIAPASRARSRASGPPGIRGRDPARPRGHAVRGGRGRRRHARGRARAPRHRPSWRPRLEGHVRRQAGAHGGSDVDSGGDDGDAPRGRRLEPCHLGHAAGRAGQHDRESAASATARRCRGHRRSPPFHRRGPRPARACHRRTRRSPARAGASPRRRGHGAGGAAPQTRAGRQPLGQRSSRPTPVACGGDPAQMAAAATAAVFRSASVGSRPPSPSIARSPRHPARRSVSSGPHRQVIPAQSRSSRSRDQRSRPSRARRPPTSRRAWALRSRGSCASRRSVSGSVHIGHGHARPEGRHHGLARRRGTRPRAARPQEQDQSTVVPRWRPSLARRMHEMHECATLGLGSRCIAVPMALCSPSEMEHPTASLVAIQGEPLIAIEREDGLGSVAGDGRIDRGDPGSDSTMPGPLFSSISMSLRRSDSFRNLCASP